VSPEFQFYFQPIHIHNSLATTVQVTRKHLAGRIDRVDISLDETQQIIEGTRDEVEPYCSIALFIYLVLMYLEGG